MQLLTSQTDPTLQFIGAQVFSKKKGFKGFLGALFKGEE